MREDFKNNPLTFWFIWIALFSSTFLYQFFLSGGIPRGKDVGEPDRIMVMIIIVMLIASCFVRWFLIPQQKDLKKLLPLMIVGLSLAESAQFFQIFIIGKNFPQTQLFIFLSCVVCVGQFIPFYAKITDAPYSSAN